MDDSPNLPRLVSASLAERLRVMPAVVVTGARQTGKSTLVRELAPAARRYFSLDDLDTARKHAGKWRDVGYDYLVCGWPGAGASQVEAFAKEVMPEFSA